MHWITTTFTIAALLAFSSVVAGQEFVNVADDARGDPMLAGVNVSPTPAADLVSLAIAENSTHILWRIQVADLDGSQTPLVDNAVYHVFLTYHGADYRIVVQRNVYAQAPTTGYEATLEQLDALTNTYSPVEVELTFESNEADGTVTGGVPFLAIRGETGFPAAPGQIITDISVESLVDFEPESGPLVGDEKRFWHDQMPDAGTVTWILVNAVSDGADFLVSVPNPVRLTNGGASTYAFTIISAHDLDYDMTLAYEAIDVPEQWTASFVDPVAVIEAGASHTNTLVVRGTSAHQHGSESVIRFQASTAENQQVVTQDVRVVFTEVPQPTGHHSRLWLHSALAPNTLPPEVLSVTNSQRVLLFMNAVMNDESDSQTSASIQVMDDGYGWSIPLDPGLGVGLDFDENLGGEYEVELVPDQATPISNVQVSGDFWVGNGADAVKVAILEAVTVQSLNAPTSFSGAITMTPDGEFIPYRAGQEFWLNINVEFDDLVADQYVNSPRLLPGGSLELPLTEYQDPAGIVPGAVIQLESSAAQGNPGRTVAVQVTIETIWDSALSVELHVLGADDAWRVETNPTTIVVAPQSTAMATMLVDIPNDSTHGDLLRFFVVAKTADGQFTAVAPMQVTVTTSEDIPSASRTPAGKDSPLPFLLPIAGLLIAARKEPRTGMLETVERI